MTLEKVIELIDWINPEKTENEKREGIITCLDESEAFLPYGDCDPDDCDYDEYCAGGNCNGCDDCQYRIINCEHYHNHNWMDMCHSPEQTEEFFDELFFKKNFDKVMEILENCYDLFEEAE